MRSGGFTLYSVLCVGFGRDLFNCESSIFFLNLVYIILQHVTFRRNSSLSSSITIGTVMFGVAMDGVFCQHLGRGGIAVVSA